MSCSGREDCDETKFHDNGIVSRAGSSDSGAAATRTVEQANRRADTISGGSMRWYGTET